MTTTEQAVAVAPLLSVEAGSTARPLGARAAPRSGHDGGRRWPRWRAALLASIGYAGLSLVLWWHVWTSGPTSTTTCGCGDSSLFQWFLEWPAYALLHGLDPWYSTALFHPTGVNLLANTAIVAVGILLAPVTWLFGPIATFNLALALAPLLSALSMFLLLIRWVRWSPAAFFGGLLYGFSPFVLIGLTDGHLMLSMAPVPPLIVWCLDEVLASQRRNAVGTGLLLAAGLAVQLLVGTELLVMVGLTATVGVAVVVVYAIFHREVLFRRARHAAVGLASAAGASAALLAYPAWFALAGPAHLSGLIWGTPLVSYGGTNAHDYVLPGPPSAEVVRLARHYGGYQAPVLSGQYFGIGLLVVLVAGLVAWRRDLRLWLFAAMAAFSVPLSFGLGLHDWTLWRLFVRLPLMDNVIPSRFLLVTYLCAAVMLGLVVDHVRFDLPSMARRAERFGRGSGSGAVRGAGVAEGAVGAGVTATGAVVAAAGAVGPGGAAVAAGRAAVMTPPRPRRLGAAAAIGASLLALLPIAVYYAGGVPFTTQRVVLPPWFRTVGAHLGGRQVVLAFPVPFDLYQSSMTWQAVDRMSFDQVGGGGPGSIPSRAGAERPGEQYMGNLSISQGSPAVSPAGVLATRAALEGWGVTLVVIPDPGGLPRYERLHAVRSAVVLMTAATGRLPARSADAWVWSRVETPGPAVDASAAQLAACGAGPEEGSIASIRQSARCVMADRTGSTASAEAFEASISSTASRP